MSILFIEFPDLHFHLDLVIDSVYIAGSYRFHFYFFFCKDFAVPLSHPLFDPSAPYIAIPLYMAHPFPPPPPPAAVAATIVPPASPPQQVPSISLSDDDDPSEATSSSSSTAPGETPALGMDSSLQNPFRGVIKPSRCWLYSVALFWHLGHRLSLVVHEMSHGDQLGFYLWEIGWIILFDSLIFIPCTVIFSFTIASSDDGYLPMYIYDVVFCSFCGFCEFSIRTLNPFVHSATKINK